MGGEAAPVKSANAARERFDADVYLRSCEMRPRVAPLKGLFLGNTLCHWDAIYLSKASGGRKRKASGKKPESPTEEPERGEEGGPDEAVAFIAETVAELVKLAERHRLEVLSHLLGMAQLEAEERLRTRSKRKLS
jgi:hypothetical protein